MRIPFQSVCLLITFLLGFSPTNFRRLIMTTSLNRDCARQLPLVSFSPFGPALCSLPYITGRPLECCLRFLHGLLPTRGNFRHPRTRHPSLHPAGGFRFFIHPSTSFPRNCMELINAKLNPPPLAPVPRTASWLLFGGIAFCLPHNSAGCT